MDVPHPPPERAPRGPWKRRLLWIGLGLGLALLAAPLVLGPLLRWALVEELEARTGGRARVQSVSCSWPARLCVRALALADAEGAPLFALDELRVRLALLPLLRGEIEGEVELTFPEIHLARAADGRWNWERPLERVLARSPDDARIEEGPRELPAVRARLLVQDGRVSIHGHGGETTLGALACELAVDGLERAAPFRLAFEARGPGGAGGRVELGGAFTAAPRGALAGREQSGEATLTLAGIDLAEWAPALTLVTPVQGLTGTLDGKAEVTLAPGLELTGSCAFEAAEVGFRGPLTGAAPTRIPRVRLAGEATQSGPSRGTQRLELEAGPFLSARYEGRSELPATGAGVVAGTLALAAELASLQEVARGWIRFQEGVAVRGRFEQSGEVELGLLDLAPASARARVRAALVGLAGTDGAGRALDLRELERVSLDLDARADIGRGSLSVPSFSLQAGPLACQGNLEAEGLGADAAAPELRAGELHAEADLERLRAALARIVALPDDALGGRIVADARLAGSEQALELTGTVSARALALAGVRILDLDGELAARRTAEGVLAGRGTLAVGASSIGPGASPRLQLPAVTATLELREDEGGKGEHALELATRDASFELGVRAHTARRGTDDLELDARFELDATAARLAELAATVAPLQAGLGGRLGARGTLGARRVDGALAEASARVELALDGLSATDGEGRALPLEALARTTLAAEAAFAGPDSRLELRSLRLAATGLELRASGTLRGLSEAGSADVEAGALSFECDLARLGPELARLVDLGGHGLGGSPLSGALEFSTRERTQVLEARGRMGTEVLRVVRPGGAPIELPALAASFDLGYDRSVGSLHVKDLALATGTASVRMAGTLNELLSPESARGALELELAGELARLLADLGLEGPESERRTAGALSARLALEGDRGAFALRASSTISGFRLELAPSSPGEAPLTVEEPSIVLGAEGRATLPALDLELTRLTLESGLARGGAEGRLENLARLGDGEVIVRGLRGSFVYLPDRLGAVLAPFLPGRLSGAEEQRVTFAFDGRARDLDLAALLGAAEGRVDLGLGRFQRPEVELGGTLVLEAKEERLLVRGDLEANGGTLQVDGALDLDAARAAPRSRLGVSARTLRLRPGLAPLLAWIHPAFARVGLAQGSLDGLLDLDLDLAYEGALTLDQLAAGWAELPKQPIQGSGRLELRSVALRGSPFLGLLGEFGVDATRTLDVRPIEFSIQDGRVTYAQPWTWTLAGTETTFTGSVGLDQGLDLAWNVPVTERLVEKWSFLARLRGQTLSIPLRGTLGAPRLDARDLLADLAQEVARAELGSRLGLGGAGSEDPAEILARADQLWSKGQRSEAAELYRRLREEFKLSLAYALNKERIKERSKLAEPPK